MLPEEAEIFCEEIMWLFLNHDYFYVLFIIAENWLWVKGLKLGDFLKAWLVIQLCFAILGNESIKNCTILGNVIYSKYEYWSLLSTS